MINQACKRMILLAILFIYPFALFGENHTMSEEKIQISMKTNKGEIKIDLLPDKSPNTVKNFLTYIEKNHFAGTIFHRVIPGFMIQGGGFDQDMSEKETISPIKNEANNGLKNARGSIAMARTTDPHSATAQFFINVNDNDFLNYSSESEQGWGYCVFGNVSSGMDIVDTIVNTPTGNAGMHQDVPVETIIIEKVSIIDE